MPDLLVAHTAHVDVTTLDRAADLCAQVFTAADGAWGEDDWEHALGGVHAIVVAGDAVVGHAAVVQRRLVHDGRAWRAGYVEAVAVDPAHRGRGHGAALMSAVEGVLAHAFDLGALSATDDAVTFYTRRGWRPWRGPTSTLSPDGPRRTPEDDGGVLVLPGPATDGGLDLDGPLACDWRSGDVW